MSSINPTTAGVALAMEYVEACCIAPSPKKINSILSDNVVLSLKGSGGIHEILAGKNNVSSFYQKFLFDCTTCIDVKKVTFTGNGLNPKMDLYVEETKTNTLSNSVSKRVAIHDKTTFTINQSTEPDYSLSELDIENENKIIEDHNFTIEKGNTQGLALVISLVKAMLIERSSENLSTLLAKNVCFNGSLNNVSRTANGEMKVIEIFNTTEFIPKGIISLDQLQIQCNCTNPAFTYIARVHKNTEDIANASYHTLEGKGWLKINEDVERRKITEIFIDCKWNI